MANELRAKFFGLTPCQNINGLLALSAFIDEVRPMRIIEMGCYEGYLSILFQIWALRNNRDFCTYDTNNHVSQNKAFQRLEIDLRLKDIFDHDTTNEIIGECQKEGITFLVGDAEPKTKCFNVFAPHLKHGDYIAIHDYFPNAEYFRNVAQERFWNWHEISGSDIQKVSDEYKYEPIHKPEFLRGAWTVRRKGK